MQTTEDGNNGSHSADSPTKILTWWQKFHFSGRLIMCSVLFGLGFVLIGGLIFAINLDNEVKSTDEDATDGMPSKPPARYVGPVIMGIGAFIVIVGVIMCLFETQVCRKKTGDARPLISGQADDADSKTSDKSPVPSSSRHKNSRHKYRKTAASPRKTKSRHAKTHSNDPQRSSSKSPPISIAKSKSYLTSSEEKFLTPPNTLDENKQALSPAAVSKASASIMKSFTSSGPSWSQSTEFLTPSTSFKDSSISMENSVEIDEKQSQVNFKAADLSDKDCSNIEYMTPLTIEEDRIQKLFIRVKNEQKEMAKQDVEQKIIAMKLNSGHTSNNLSFPQASTSAVKEKDKTIEDGALLGTSTEDFPSKLTNTPVLKSDSVQNSLLHTDAIQQKKNITDESTDPISFPVGSEAPAQYPTSVNIDIGNKLTNTPSLHSDKANLEEENNTEEHDFPSAEELETPSKRDTGVSSDFGSSTKDTNPNNNKNETQLDLESSSSSAETVVSRDILIEKPEDNESEEYPSPPAAKEIPTNDYISESPDIKSATSHNESNQQSVATGDEKCKEAEITDQKISDDGKKDENCLEKITENSS